MDANVCKDLLECAKQQKEIQDKQLDLLTQLSAMVPQQVKPLKQLLKLAEADHSEVPQTKTGMLRKNETACSALLRIAIAHANDQAETWKSGLDVQLIFIALFIAIVSAFEIFALQSLPEDHTDIFVILSTLWSIALMLGIIAAILTMSGRQWLSSYVRVPDGDSSYEKLAKHQKIAESVQNHLPPILGLISPMLFGSILLFIAGIVYQIWHLTHDTKSWWSYAGATVNTVLVGITGCCLLWTLLHGTLYDESPFTTQFTRLIRHFWLSWNLLSHHTRKSQDLEAEADVTTGSNSMTDSGSTTCDPEAGALSHVENSGYVHQLLCLTSDPKDLDDAAPTIIPYFKVRAVRNKQTMEMWLRLESLKAMLKALKFNTTIQTKLTIAKICTSFFDLNNTPLPLPATSGVEQGLIEELEAQFLSLYREAIEAEAKHRTYYLSALVAVWLSHTLAVEIGVKTDLASAYQKSFECFFATIMNHATELHSMLINIGPHLLYEFELLYEHGKPAEFKKTVQQEAFVRYILGSWGSVSLLDWKIFYGVEDGVVTILGEVLKGNPDTPATMVDLALEIVRDTLQSRVDGKWGVSCGPIVAGCHFLQCISSQLVSSSEEMKKKHRDCVISVLWTFINQRIDWDEYNEFWYHEKMVVELLKGYGPEFLQTMELPETFAFTPTCSLMRILEIIYKQWDPTVALGQFDFSKVTGKTYWSSGIWNDIWTEIVLFFLSNSQPEWLVHDPHSVGRFIKFGQEKFKDREEGDKLKQGFCNLSQSLLAYIDLKK